jgi:hypothetical protein
MRTDVHDEGNSSFRTSANVPGLSTGLKRPGRGIDHSLPPSADVKESVEVYLHPLSGPPWPVAG